MMGRVERFYARALELVAMALMLGLVGVIAYSVFARQALRISVAWSEEVGAGLLAWMSMLGAAAVWQRRGHIAIDVLLHRLPLRPRWALSIAIEILCLLLFVVAFRGSFRMLSAAANNHTTALGVSFTWLYLALVIGLGSMILFSVLHLGRLLRRGPAMVDRAGGSGWSTS
jgi:TRAP-type transport system small permease protein